MNQERFEPFSRSIDKPNPREADSYIQTQRQRLTQVQRDRQLLEEDIYRRTHAIQQQQLQKWEEKRQRDQEVLDYRNRELHSNLYGKERFSPDAASDARLESSPRPRVLEDMISIRNKEHGQKREEYTLHMRQLNNERERLITESEKVSEKMRALREHQYDNDDLESIIITNNKRKMEYFPSPMSSTKVHSVSSYVRDVKKALPDLQEKLLALKIEFDERKRRLYMPYRGELGIHSYHNWQLPHYHMVRGIVEEVVGKFLDMYFRSTSLPAADATTERAMIEEQSRDLARTRNSLAIQAVADETLQKLLEEVVHGECVMVATEYTQISEMTKVLAANMILKQVEIVTTGEADGRPEDDPAFNIVTKAFHRIKKNRDKYRKDIWGHSQNVTVKGQTAPLSAPEEDDVVILKFHFTIPSHLRNLIPQDSDSGTQQTTKKAFLDYQNAETSYWKGFVADVHVVNLSKRCHGAHSVKFSKNKKLLAVGTGHGDLIVYEMAKDDMKVIRALRNESMQNDAVIDVAWSISGGRLLTVDKKGTVSIWSMAPGEVSKSGVKALELRTDSEMFVPPPLTLLSRLQADSRDFDFTAGPLFTMNSERIRQGPVLADFHPGMTLLGSQTDVFIALNSGNVLKCDLKRKILASEPDLNLTPNIVQEKISVDSEEEVNVVGQDIPAELFRQHRSAVISMCFVEGLKNLVTVDQNGYINVWRYEREQLTEFHWFKPFQKYRLLTTKYEYVPARDSKSEVVFSDKQTQSGKTRQEIARERESAEETIHSLNLGPPWYTDSSDTGFVKHILPISEDMGTGNSVRLFHVVIRHSNNNLLSVYGRRTFKPVEVPCSKLMCCESSPDGTQMVFVLLFPQFKLRGPHVSVVILNLLTMTVQDLRLDIPLTAEEYTKCHTQEVLHCCVTNRHRVTKSSYLFLYLNGSLMVYSLVTGSPVLLTDGATTDRHDFNGFGLQMKLLQSVNLESKFLVSLGDDSITVIFYSENSRAVTKLYIQYNSDDTKDQSVVEAWEKLEESAAI